MGLAFSWCSQRLGAVPGSSALTMPAVLQEEQLRAARMEITKLTSAKESAAAKMRMLLQQKAEADRARDDLKCAPHRPAAAAC